MFQDERVLEYSHDLVPWYTDFTNYMESIVVREDLSSHQRKKFMHDVKSSSMMIPCIKIALMGLFVVLFMR